MFELESFADMVVTAGYGTIGTDLFLYHSPAEVNDCIIMYPSNDPPAIDPDTPDYLIAKFQTIVRCTKHDTGLALCRNLINTFTVFNLDLPQIFIKQVRPLYQPRIYRRSDSGALEMSVTYEARFVSKL